MTEYEFDALKRDYDRDGFVVLPGYLTAAEVDVLRNRAIPLAEELIKTEGGTGSYRNLLKSLHRHDDWFNQQLTDGRHEICGDRNRATPAVREAHTSK